MSSALLERMRIALAVVVALAALLTGCSSGAHHDTRAHYLHVVRTELHAANHRGDGAMIRYAHFVCRAFESGGTWNQQIAATVTPDVTATQAGHLVTAATVAFCPRYRDKLPG